MNTQQFHSHHGSAVRLRDNQTVACRTAGFCHGICFSSRPLHPMELFVVEITSDEQELRSGHLRVGLTELDPNDDFVLPGCSLPDLTKMTDKKACILAVPEVDISNLGSSFRQCGIIGNDDYLDTYRGTCSRTILEAVPQLRETVINTNSRFVRSTAVGSRIGIFYHTVGDLAVMHVLLNGKDCGHYAIGIPYKRRKIYAVVDVYGKTREVRIVQINSGTFFVWFI